MKALLIAMFTIFTLVVSGGRAGADVVHDETTIVDGKLCVGLDCAHVGEFPGGEFDTVRLKENNLRVHFRDTSSSSVFPTNDWRITINDSANGGASYFAVDDVDAGARPFLIEAGAPDGMLVLGADGILLVNGVAIGTEGNVAELEERIELLEAQVEMLIDALTDHTHAYLTGKGKGHNNTEAITGSPQP